MSDDDICSYIKRHEELYKRELNIIDGYLKKEYNVVHPNKQIIVEINDD